MSTSSTDAAGRGISPVTVTEIKLRFVEDGRDGLLAWASCVLNGTVVLNNIAVRRGREGGLMLTYPAKQTTAGTPLLLLQPDLIRRRGGPRGRDRREGARTTRSGRSTARPGSGVADGSATDTAEASPEPGSPRRMPSFRRRLG